MNDREHNTSKLLGRVSGNLHMAYSSGADFQRRGQLLLTCPILSDPISAWLERKLEQRRRCALVFCAGTLVHI